MAKSSMHERVKRRLSDLGRSPIEAAKKGDLERNFIKDFIEGRKSSFGERSLAKVAAGLDWSVADLLGQTSTDEQRRLPEGHEFEDPPAGGFVYDGGRDGIPEGEIPHVDARIGMGTATDAPTVQIPMGDDSVAAVPVLDTWKIPRNVLQRRLRGAVTALHIVECEGDSMEPRIRDGDFVFIDTSRRVPSPPGIFALNDGFGQTLKRIEIVPNTDPPKVRIIPENPRHESYERSLDEVRIIGRYLCRLTMD